MKDKLPLVSIIIVNYNGKKFLNECLASLYGVRYPQELLEVILVDNGSSDGSIEFVRQSFPAVKIIVSGENNYARANNLGIKAAQGEYLVFINNDITVDKDWLGELVGCFKGDTAVGAASSKIFFKDKVTIQGAGQKQFKNFYWGDRGFKEKDKGQYEKFEEVESASGCSAIYSRECLNEVGLFDEDFVMYLEDIDLGQRCKKKGYKIIYCPKSIVYHAFHGTIGSEANARHWQETNRLILIAKHWPEKLAEALSGRDYFTVKDDHAFSDVKDISQVLGKVFAKVIKEHGMEVANSISENVFAAVCKIYNFEKDLLIREVEQKDLFIASLGEKATFLAQDKDKELLEKDRKLKAKDDEVDNLAMLIKQKDQELLDKDGKLKAKDRQIDDLALLIKAKDQELAEKNHTITLRDQEITVFVSKKDEELKSKDRDIFERDNRINVLSSILQDKDKQILAKDEHIAVNDKVIDSMLSQKGLPPRELLDKEGAALRKELQGIYTSTGYRYLLKPLWAVLWKIKRPVATGIRSVSAGLRKARLSLKGFYLQACSLAKGTFGFSERDLWRQAYFEHIRSGTLPPPPETATLMLTKRCNLRCAFCDIQNVNEQMSTEDACRVADNVSRVGTTLLVLTGGEPFLHEGLFDIARYAKDKGLKTCITTNGTLILENLQKIIEAKIDVVSVSLDGLGDIHDSLRGCPGLAEKVKKGILELKRLEKDRQYVSINFVVTKKNVQELEGVYAWARKENIFLDFWPVNFHVEMHIDKDGQYAQFKKFVSRLKGRKEISREKYRYFLNTRLYVTPGGKGLRFRCLGLARQFGIDIDGTITPCCVWSKERFDLGNAVKDDLEQLWFSEPYHKLRCALYSQGCSNGCYNNSLHQFMAITGKDFIIRSR